MKGGGKAIKSCFFSSHTSGGTSTLPLAGVLRGDELKMGFGARPCAGAGNHGPNPPDGSPVDTGLRLSESQKQSGAGLGLWLLWAPGAACWPCACSGHRQRAVPWPAGCWGHPKGCGLMPLCPCKRDGTGAPAAPVTEGSPDEGSWGLRHPCPA